MSDYELESRNRLTKQINQIPHNESIVGWQCMGTRAIGGLTEIGFSKQQEMLLVVSSQGRGVFDCVTGKRLIRDNEEDVSWLDLQALTCQEISCLADETIAIAGLHGGGLPLTNTLGDALVVVAPNWPIFNLVFCPEFHSLYDEKNNTACTMIASVYLRAYGFSWSGRSFAYATGSDVTIYTKTY